jgi:CDP-glycerol glycerophosphotransferase
MHAAPHSATSSPASLPPGDDALRARLEQLEDFQTQASAAVDQVVSALLELKQASADKAAVDALQAKVKELEQALSIERAGRDLAQVSRMHPKTRSVVFVGTTYFGCNVKYAFLAARERLVQLGLQVWWLPYNEAQQAQVEALGGPCLPAAHANWTPEHLHAALSAAVVVTSDHLLNPNPFAAALLAGARQVQLWHGVSIKEIGLRNLPGGRALGPHMAKVLATCGPYARMVGTAAEGEAEWRRWFSFANYAPIGYPRNDVLYRDPSPADLANVDLDTLGRAQGARSRGKRVFLYAPTFRDADRGRWLLAAGLPRVAEALHQAGHLLVVNLHPVEQPMIAQLAPHLPGVQFVAPRTDIYPLLASTSALVTDYSSLMFDYLHLQRPVLLFRPDHASYTAQSRRLFDDKLDSLPGPLVDKADALSKLLLAPRMGQDAVHEHARSQLLRQWFDHHDGHSADRLMQVLADELQCAGV